MTIEWQTDALKRIYAAAEGILQGEENPQEAAQDIQRMVMNGLQAREIWPWSHKRHPAFDGDAQ